MNNYKQLSVFFKDNIDNVDTNIRVIYGTMEEINVNISLCRYLEFELLDGLLSELRAQLFLTIHDIK
jgi:hypothetical protein